MAVSALSTTATALTASPAATPVPSPPDATKAPAFAKLVARAGSEDNTGQEPAKSETGMEDDGETVAVIAEDAAPVRDGDGKGERSAQPGDLLAEIEAMVAAASQIGVTQPVAVVATVATSSTNVVPTVSTKMAPATPGAATTTAVAATSQPPAMIAGRQVAASHLLKDAPERQAASPAVGAAALPVVSTSAISASALATVAPAPTGTRASATMYDSATATPIAAPTAALAVPAAIEAPAGRADLPAAAIADPAQADPAAARVKAPRGNIAALLASLKSAFAPVRAPIADITPTVEGATLPVPAAATDMSTVAERGVVPTMPAAVPTDASAIAEGGAVPPLPETRIADSVAVAPQPGSGVESAAIAAAPLAIDASDPAAPASAEAVGVAHGTAETVSPDVQRLTPDTPSAIETAAKAPSPADAAAPEAVAAPRLRMAAGSRLATPSSDIAVPTAETRDSAAGDAPPAAAAAASSAAATTAPTLAPLDIGLGAIQPGRVVASAPADIAAAAVSTPDITVDRHLDLARDYQWLDRLARDITQAATQQGHLKFQLNPEHLGALTVEIANSAAGTAIKLTAETDQARTIIADAQPRLIAEVRAQGVRVSETHVELNNQQSGGGSASAQSQQGQAQQQRQSSADHQPFGRTQAVIRDDAGDSAPRDDGELYA